jgi:hypothetical protein
MSHLIPPAEFQGVADSVCSAQWEPYGLPPEFQQVIRILRSPQDLRSTIWYQVQTPTKQASAAYAITDQPLFRSKAALEEVIRRALETLPHKVGARLYSEDPRIGTSMTPRRFLEHPASEILPRCPPLDPPSRFRSPRNNEEFRKCLMCGTPHAFGKLAVWGSSNLLWLCEPCFQQAYPNIQVVR